jgi:uncharacterized protein (TIGR02217 family)
MAYPVFPTLPGMAMATKRSPVWRTGEQFTLSGKDTTISYMSYPLYQWSVDLAALRSYGGMTELAQMIGFVNNVAGKAGSFLWLDPEDNAVVAQGFGTGNGTLKTFYLVRAYGGFTEPVQQPGGQAGNPGSITIYVNGVAKVQGTDWSFGTLPGSIVFVTAPASSAALTWTGPFYFLCRFMQDSQEFGQEFWQAWSTSALKFQSRKL